MQAADLKNLVDTIVIVMLENRSFDHILGYLRHASFGNRRDVDGLVSSTEPTYANFYQGEPYFPFNMKPDKPLVSDLPHERSFVHQQLDYSNTTGDYTMRGFVNAYYNFTNVNRSFTPDPMGFFAPPQIPITDFLAQNYMICDRWFAPLPASTQPNRLVALSGYSQIDVTRSDLLPDQTLVFDWLSRHDVRWRVYHSGISFLLLFQSMWANAVSDRFRRFNALAADFQNEPDATFPQVIFIEPAYHDSPVHLTGHPNDNHPPLPVGVGEEFLRQTYQAVTSNYARWKKTFTVVTYDEHGGFFDHVPPLPIPAADPNNVYPPFDSTGVRVPSIIVSPLVETRSVYHGNLDHTSILQFLAERFAPNETYSNYVEQRRGGDPAIQSVSTTLNRSAPRTSLPRVTGDPIPVSTALSGVKESVTDNQRAFVAAIEGLLNGVYKDAAIQKFPEISHWDGVP